MSFHGPRAHLRCAAGVSGKLREVPTIRERATMGADSSTPVSMLRELASDRSPKVRAAVAGNASTPGDVLNSLADDPRWEVRFAVADNPSAGSIRSALGSSCYDVRGLVAQRDDLDPTSRQRLLRDPDRRVRQRMAESCSDRDSLAALARDPDPRVRATTVHNPRLPVAVIEQLADDPIAGVRASVAASGRVGSETLTRLANDRSAAVRWSVLTNNPGRRDLLELLGRDSDEMNAQQARSYLFDLE